MKFKYGVPPTPVIAQSVFNESIKRESNESTSSLIVCMIAKRTNHYGVHSLYVPKLKDRPHSVCCEVFLCADLAIQNGIKCLMVPRDFLLAFP